MVAQKNGTWKWMAGILATIVVSTTGWFVSHTAAEIANHKRSVGHPVMVERLKMMQGCVSGIQKDLSEIRHDQRKILLELQSLKARTR